MPIDEPLTRLDLIELTRQDARGPSHPGPGAPTTSGTTDHARTLLDQGLGRLRTDPDGQRLHTDEKLTGTGGDA